MSREPGAPGGPSAPRVFICYRREETAAHAGRLYDSMVARFGEGNVFMDVDLAPGVDFVERITQVVSGCLVLIVVIGRNWATVKDEHGGVRIADPTDFVRLEIETGLSHPDVTPIPVLVSGARMPKPGELPPELRAITRRNALELSDARWGYDVGRLIAALDELLADIGRTEAADPTPTPAPGPPGWRLILEAMLVAGAAAFAGRWLGDGISVTGGTAAKIAEVLLRRAETWAVVGAALAVYMAARTERTDLVRLGLWGLLIGAIAGAVGGAIWALPVELADLSGEAAKWIEVGSLAATGGILGALIGALWRPRRVGAGFAGGAIAAALLQLVVIGSRWEINSKSEQALKFGLAAMAIAALTLAALLSLGRGRPVPEAGRNVTAV